MRRLLIRPGAIGDCILSLPALQYLKTDYTEVWISKPLVPLIHFADKVRSIASTRLDMAAVGDLDFPAQLQEELESFDSIVSWYGANRPELRETFKRLKTPCTFFAALPPANYAGHASEFFAEQVGADLHAVPSIRPAMSADLRNSIVIHPFSGSQKKNWPLASFRQLAEQLPDVQVEWTAGPEDTLEGAVRFESLCDLAGWISHARLYVGNDSGITHLAAATGVRTLALFGPTDPQKWAPRGANVTTLRAENLNDLTIDEVARAVSGLLDVRPIQASI